MEPFPWWTDEQKELKNHLRSAFLSGLQPVMLLLRPAPGDAHEVSTGVRARLLFIAVELT